MPFSFRSISLPSGLASWGTKLESGKSRGFALVISLVLMAFLVLLMLSMTMLLQLELRLSTQAVQMEKARENARLGLLVAMAELQKAAGPDQRVTGRADIRFDDDDLGEPGNRYWTGVWDNRLSTALDARPDNMLNYGANRGGDGRLTTPPRWLVSSFHDLPVDAPRQSIVDYNNPEDGAVGVVYLVGETTSGADDGVRAGMIPVGGGSGRSEGHFAWWVGDEGVKAKVNLTDRTRSLHSDDFFRQWSLLSPQKSNLRGFPDFAIIDPSDDRLERVLNLSQMASLANPPVDAGEWTRGYFHDLTPHSYGVLSDTRLGGLKVDLSRGLEEQWPEFLALHDINNSRVSRDGIEWANMASVFRAAPDGNPIDGPYWDVLYSYYHLHKPHQPFAPAFNNSDDEFSGVFYEGYQGGKWVGDFLFYNVASRETRPGNQLGGPTGMTAQIQDPMLWTARELPPRVMPRSGVPSGHSAVQRARLSLPGALVTGGGKEPPLEHPDQGGFFHKRRDFDISQPSANRGGDPTRLLRNRRDPVYNMLTPVMVRAGIRLAIDTVEETHNVGTPSEETGYRLRILFHPFVVLWNPYNITLDNHQYEVQMGIDMPIQIYVGGAPILDDGGAGLTGGILLSDLVRTNARKINPAASLPRTDSTTSVDRAFAFTTDSISIGPGQYQTLTSPRSAFTELYTFGYSDGRSTMEDGLNLGMNSTDFSMENGVFMYLDDVSKEGAVSRRGHRDNDLNPIPLLQEDLPVMVRFFPHEEAGSFELRLPHRSDIWDFDNPWRKVIGVMMDKAAWIPPGSLAVDIDLMVTTGQLHGQPVDIATFEVRHKETSSNAPATFSQLNPRKTHGHRLLRFSNDDDYEPVLIERDMVEGISNFTINGETIGGNYLAYAGSKHGPGGETHAVLFDAPRQPLHSVGDFMHANISWLEHNPTYAVGGGYASPQVSSGLYYADRSTWAGLPGEGASRTERFTDYSYLLNTALFDRYFLSTIPIDWNNAPETYGDYSNDAVQNLPPFAEGPYNASYLEDGKPFPNARMVPFWRDEVSAPDLFDKLHDLRTAAAHLMVDGAFNINSTSVRAWKAFLGGLRVADDFSYRIYNAATAGEIQLDSSDLRYPIPRFSAPVGGRADRWAGYRDLSDDQLAELAEAIVEEVRARGPFLSLADFVNRRLTTGEHGRRGALQAAIDKTSINSGFSGTSAAPPGTVTNLGLSAEAGLPGYLLQNDILRNFGQLMSARSDTFTIRAYGDAVNPLTGEVTARVWCEAIVQRLPDYVDSANVAEDQVYQNGIAYTGDWRSAEWLPALHANNQRFGRRFVIREFRWLGESETR